MNKRTGMDAWEAFDVIAIDDYDEKPCALCGGELEYEDCPDCGGEGEWEETTYDPDSWAGRVTCDTCRGDGGWFYCPHPHEVGWNV